MRKTLLESLYGGTLTEPAPRPGAAERAALAAELDRLSLRRLGRSLAIRVVDAGSCNGCELEINALANVFYDLERLGLRFVASPRHADVMLITGPLSRNMEAATRLAFAAMPAPKFVVAVGDCAGNGGLFRASPQCLGGAGAVLPLALRIPGCPPSPTALLKGLIALLEVEPER